MSPACSGRPDRGSAWRRSTSSACSSPPKRTAEAAKAFAYVLIDGIGRVALKKTTLAKAVPNTIRLKLLKVGAKVINSVRRIKLSLPDACPYKDLFFKAHAALAPP